MTPSFRKIHNRFKLNGFHFSFSQLSDVAYDYIKEGLPFEQELGRFILDWIDEKDFIYANTSGSTGTPKQIKLLKQSMVNSAIATGNFFNLSPGNKALLCLPIQYIAGKMMLVRALILGLELDIIEPSSKLEIPAVSINYDFSAMVPLQVKNSIHAIDCIKTLIVGGAPMSQELKDTLQSFSTKVYETYGMTETVTHIALKKINHFNSENDVSKNLFYTLSDVEISQDHRGCLIIKAPRITSETIITNDVVKLHSETAFEWLGRFDNVINSGGVKLFPEQIEAKLQSKINTRFFVASRPEKVLGEQLILVLESDTNDLSDSVFANLDKYEVPKAVYAIHKFEETASGKVQRAATLKKIKI